MNNLTRYSWYMKISLKPEDIYFFFRFFFTSYIVHLISINKFKAPFEWGKSSVDLPMINIKRPLGVLTMLTYLFQCLSGNTMHPGIRMMAGSNQ